MNNARAERLEIIASSNKSRVLLIKQANLWRPGFSPVVIA